MRISHYYYVYLQGDGKYTWAVCRGHPLLTNPLGDRVIISIIQIEEYIADALIRDYPL